MYFTKKYLFSPSLLCHSYSSSLAYFDTLCLDFFCFLIFKLCILLGCSAPYRIEVHNSISVGGTWK